MITIENRITFSLEGLSEKEKEEYIKKADDQEKTFKKEGVFWGRIETNSSITVISQTYLDIKKF